MVLVNLVGDFVDGDDLGDLLDGWDDLVLGLVMLVDHGLVDLDNVEVVLVEVVLERGQRTQF